jgi:hypothetical protein
MLLYTNASVDNASSCGQTGRHEMLATGSATLDVAHPLAVADRCLCADGSHPDAVLWHHSPQDKCTIGCALAVKCYFLRAHSRSCRDVQSHVLFGEEIYDKIGLVVKRKSPMLRGYLAP